MFAARLQATRARAGDFCRHTEPQLLASGADELAGRPLARSALEPQDEPEPQSVGQPLQRIHAGLAPAALDAGDGGVTGPHPSGQLFLGQAQSGTMLDHQAGELLEGSQTLLLGTVSRTRLAAAALEGAKWKGVCSAATIKVIRTEATG